MCLPKIVMAVAIDTLAYARRLREAGFTEQQAEGQAAALAAAMTDTLATKQDLHEQESRLDLRFARIDARFAQVDARFDQVDARFAQVDARFEHLERQMETRFAHVDRQMETRISELEKRFELRLTDLEHRMTVRLGSITVAGIGVVSMIVKLL